MKKLILITILLTLTISCEKEENYIFCGKSPINNDDSFVKNGKCFQFGDYTWNYYKRADKEHCPCL